LTSKPVSDKQARKSALLVGAVLAAIAAWNVYKQRPTLAWALGAPGGLLVLIGLLSAAAAQLFHRVWMRVAGVLGWVNSRILLSLLFFLVLTPYGLAMRLFRDPLRRRGGPADSYWIPRKYPRQPRERFERLF